MELIDIHTINAGDMYYITYIGNPNNISALKNEIRIRTAKGIRSTGGFFIDEAVKYNLYAAAYEKDYTIDNEMTISGTSEVAQINRWLILLKRFLSANDLFSTAMIINNPIIKESYKDIISDEKWNNIRKGCIQYWKDRLC